MGRVVQASLAAVSLLTPARLSVSHSAVLIAARRTPLRVPRPLLGTTERIAAYADAHQARVAGRLAAGGLRLVSVLRSTRGTLLHMDIKQDGPHQEVAAGKQKGTRRLECCGERCSPSGCLAGCSVAYLRLRAERRLGAVTTVCSLIGATG